MRTKPPKGLANFDAASVMVRSVARYHEGKDFPSLGLGPLLRALGPLAERLPDGARDAWRPVDGWSEALAPDRLDQVEAEKVAEWITGLYPGDRRYPAVLLGSQSGAVPHLACALGAPWLPQTFLVPVAPLGVHPDDVTEAMEAAVEPARRLLEANPELQLHHVHDPNHGRLLLHLITSFRVKWRRLSQAYRRFLEESLEPGATLFLVEGRRSWPTTRIGERHVFQMGGPGGPTPQEFLHGSERVEAFLERYGSHRRQWDPPPPDGHAPEGEWGFEPAIRGDIETFARERGHRLVRLVFQEPEHLSPLVADLYRGWYRSRNLRAARLLVDSSVLHDPWWTLQTGSVPFWLSSAMAPSARWLEAYLSESEPYDFIHMMLHSHGVDSVGLEPVEGWRGLLGRARRTGGFVGVDEQSFPRDFATFERYHDELKKIPGRYGIPGALSVSAFESFVAANRQRFAVAWREGAAVPV